MTEEKSVAWLEDLETHLLSVHKLLEDAAAKIMLLDAQLLAAKADTAAREITIRAAEREACAERAEEFENGALIAAAIRARDFCVAANPS